MEARVPRVPICQAAQRNSTMMAPWRPENRESHDFVRPLTTMKLEHLQGL